MPNRRLKGQSLDAWDTWLDEEMNVERFREFVTRQDPHGAIIYKCLIESTMYKHLLGALKEAIAELRRTDAENTVAKARAQPCSLCSIDDGLVREWVMKARSVARTKGLLK